MTDTQTQERRLDKAATGSQHTITGLPGGLHEHAAAFIRAQAMGLQPGKQVQVLRRNGRMMLLQIGATCLAISAEMAQHIKIA